MLKDNPTIARSLTQIENERSVMNKDAESESTFPTDQTLIRRFREGSQDAASEIYLRYAKRLQATAKKQTSTDLAVRKGADDIVQSVFRTFFRRVAVGQYEVVDGEDLWKLFLVIALNKIRTAAEYHRAQKRDVRRSKSVDSDLYRALSGRQNDEQVAMLVLQMTIEDILEKIPESNRELVRYRIEGFSVAEVAEKSGRALRSVERVLQNFRSRLWEEIEVGDES